MVVQNDSGRALFTDDKLKAMILCKLPRDILLAIGEWLEPHDALSYVQAGALAFQRELVTLDTIYPLVSDGATVKRYIPMYRAWHVSVVGDNTLHCGYEVNGVKTGVWRSRSNTDGVITKQVGAFTNGVPTGRWLMHKLYGTNTQSAVVMKQSHPNRLCYYYHNHAAYPVNTDLRAIPLQELVVSDLTLPYRPRWLNYANEVWFFQLIDGPTNTVVSQTIFDQGRLAELNTPGINVTFTKLPPPPPPTVFRRDFLPQFPVDSRLIHQPRVNWLYRRLPLEIIPWTGELVTWGNGLFFTHEDPGLGVNGLIHQEVWQVLVGAPGTPPLTVPYGMGGVMPCGRRHGPWQWKEAFAVAAVDGGFEDRFDIYEYGLYTLGVKTGVWHCSVTWTREVTVNVYSYNAVYDQGVLNGPCEFQTVANHGTRLQQVEAVGVGAFVDDRLLGTWLMATVHTVEVLFWAGVFGVGVPGTPDATVAWHFHYSPGGHDMMWLYVEGIERLVECNYNLAGIKIPALRRW